MHSSLQGQLLKEAISLGDELIFKAKTDQYGISWLSLKKDYSNGLIEWQSDENIYFGNAGILLFFLELFKHTGNNKYLEIIEEGCKWLVNQDDDSFSESYASYNNKLFTAFVLAKTFRITKKNRYLDTSIEFLQRLNFQAIKNTPTCNFINGVSGSLFLLLKLYDLIEKKEIEPEVISIVFFLLNQIKVMSQGFFLKSTYFHELSGVAFVFLELGKYSGNESFYWIAKEFVKYEKYAFKELINSSSNFRTKKNTYAVPFRFIRSNKNISNDYSYYDGSFMKSLYSLNAYKLLKNEQFLTDIKLHIWKIDNTYHQPTSYHSLPHCLWTGSCGKALILLNASILLGNMDYLQRSRKLIKQTINFRRDNNYYISGYFQTENTEDTSLLMGDAGIGYTLLKILELSNRTGIEEKSDSSKVCKKQNVLRVSPKKIKEIILHNNYPKTRMLINNGIFKNQIYDFNFNDFLNEKSLFDSLKDKVEAELLMDIKKTYHFEKSKIRMDKAITFDSYAFQNSKFKKTK